jgi:hypothetical protein
MNSVVGHAVGAAMGGPFAIGAFALRNMGRLSWPSLLKWIVVLFAGYALLASALHTVVTFSEQLRIERTLTETAQLKATSCAGMDEVMLYDPAVYAVCLEAKRVVATSPLERTWTHMVKQWPNPMQLLSLIANSTEKQFYTFCVLATLALSAWQVLAPLRWQVVEGIDRRRAAAQLKMDKAE